MRTRMITIIIIAAFASGIAFKLNDVRQSKTEEIGLVQRSVSDVPVTVIPAQYSDADIDISYHGTFESNYEVTVVSEAQGRVEEFFIEEGALVSEGKLIALLENDILSYQLETAEAAYQKALSDLKRFENLSPGEAVSAQQMEDIRLAEKNARNSWLTLKKQYDNTFIKAPIPGIVSKRYIERGSFIAQGAPVIDIIDNSKMKFCAWFTANDLVKVKPGANVKISAGLYPDVTYNGTIKVIGIKPDESKRYRVQAEILNDTDHPVLSGTDGTLFLSTKQYQKSIIIPRNCIVGNTSEASVYVIDQGVARLRPVVINGIINRQAMISGGISEGDMVVYTGQINLRDSTKVNVIKTETL